MRHQFDFLQSALPAVNDWIGQSGQCAGILKIEASDVPCKGLGQQSGERGANL